MPDSTAPIYSTAPAMSAGAGTFQQRSDTCKDVILELLVRNHPGTMSHITGLFARRAFNLEAILVVPMPGESTSRVLLHMADEPKLAQVEKQLAKLHDVLSVRHRVDLTPAVFQQFASVVPAAEKLL